MSLLTLFQSYRDDGEMIMKNSAQQSVVQSQAEFYLRRNSNLGLHYPESGALTTRPLGAS